MIVTGFFSNLILVMEIDVVFPLPFPEVIFFVTLLPAASSFSSKVLSVTVVVIVVSPITTLPVFFVIE